MRCLLIHKPILHRIFEYLPIISQMSFKRAIHPCYRKNLPNIYECCRERLVVILDKCFCFKHGYDGKQIMQYMDTHNFCITEVAVMTAVLKGFYIEKKHRREYSLKRLMPSYWMFGCQGYGINKNLLTVRQPREIIQSHALAFGPPKKCPIDAHAILLLLLLPIALYLFCKKHNIW